MTCADPECGGQPRDVSFPGGRRARKRAQRINADAREAHGKSMF